MYWIIKIKMWSHDGRDWHWAECCRVESSEMLGIVERALSAAQEIAVEKHEYKSPEWAKVTA